MQMKPPPPTAEHSSPLTQTFSTKKSNTLIRQQVPPKYHKVDAAPFWDRQHCRLTLWKYDSWNSRNSRHHQRVVLSEENIQIILLILKRDPVYFRNALFGAGPIKQYGGNPFHPWHNFYLLKMRKTQALGCIFAFTY